MCLKGEAGYRLQDKIYSMHSWHQAGCSVISSLLRHDGPNPPSQLKVSCLDEVYAEARICWRMMGSKHEFWELAPTIQPVEIGQLFGNHSRLYLRWCIRDTCWLLFCFYEDRGSLIEIARRLLCPHSQRRGFEGVLHLHHGFISRGDEWKGD